MNGALEGPLAAHLIDARQEGLAEASGLLNLSEDRFDDLLAQSVAAAMTGAPQPLAHGLDLRPAPLAIAAVGIVLAPGGAVRPAPVLEVTRLAFLALQGREEGGKAPLRD